MEEFLASTILSGIAYDVMKCGVVMSINELKQRLKGWIISDSELLVLAPTHLKNSSIITINYLFLRINPMSCNFLDHFSTLKDPRIDRRKLHQLPDILFLAISAVLSGVD